MLLRSVQVGSCIARRPHRDENLKHRLDFGLRRFQALFTSLTLGLFLRSSPTHFTLASRHFPSLSPMPINRESTPTPVIGKMGPYTVFMTPPSTPKPTAEPLHDSPKKAPPPLPPVQPPPQQFDKSLAVSNGSLSDFLKNAVTKVQNAHSSLDDHLARWFGLNQSKYQWALDDYYESKGLGKEVAKAREMSGKV